MESFRQRLLQNTQFYDPTTMGTEANPNGRFGEIPGYPVGSTFADRKECLNAGVHTQNTAGISGSVSAGGAYSIVVSGGYVDQDHGDVIIYTGTGGQEDRFSGGGPQTKDQSFAHPSNAALQKSQDTKRPVRVIRGSNGRSHYSPASGYRYDGLYTVEDAKLVKGQNNLAICQFRLRRLPGQPPIPTNPMAPAPPPYMPQT